jgi:hypothetical protein
LALIWIGIFGALVLALLSYVYWSTATYVRHRADRAVAAEQMIVRPSARHLAGITGTNRRDRAFNRQEPLCPAPQSLD